MKLKTHRFLLLLLLCGMAEIGTAQVARIQGDFPGPSKNNPALKGLRNSLYEYSHYMMGVYVDGGYSAMIPDAQISATPGGYTAGVGFQFEYIEKMFITQVGVSARWQDTYNNVPSGLQFDSKVTYNNAAYPFIFQYTSRLDQARNLYLQVPILLGLNFRGAYFLVGPKISIQCAGSTSVHVQDPDASIAFSETNVLPVTLNKTYNRLDVNKGKLEMQPLDLQASVELGYEWIFESSNRASFGNRNNASQRIRLAAFADFSMLNIHKVGIDHSNNELEPNGLYYPGGRGARFTTDFNHVLHAGKTDITSVRNCFAGVRLTYVFYDYRFSHKSYKFTADRRHRSRRVH